MSEISFSPKSFADNSKIESFVKTYKLDPVKLEKSGLEAEDSRTMPLDVFRNVAGNEGKITPSKIVKYANNNLNQNTIADMFQNQLNSSEFNLSSYKNDAGQTVNLEWKVKFSAQIGLNISVINKDTGKNISPSDILFSLLRSKDNDKDGKLDVATEISNSKYLNTVDEALTLAGTDKKISDKEAFLHIISIQNPLRADNFKYKLDNLNIDIN